MDYIRELMKLIEAESTPPEDPLTELTRAQTEMLSGMNAVFSGVSTKISDVSLQTEEIYDIIKEADDSAKELKIIGKRENTLIDGIITLSDMIDDMLRYIASSPAGGAHAETAAAKANKAIYECGLQKIGHLGQTLDPRCHTVVSAEHSAAPRETVIRILESGYEYRGKIVRKAAVIISKGSESS